MAIANDARQTTLACGIGLFNGAWLTGLAWVERDAYIPWAAPIGLVLVAVLVIGGVGAALFRRTAIAKSLLIIGLVTFAAFYAGVMSVR